MRNYVNQRPNQILKPRCGLTLFFTIAVIMFTLAGAAVAQSTDPQSPTPLTANEIAGGEVAERTSYYFSFEGGPGEVTAALAAKMKKGVKGGSVGIELLDANSKSLASALLSGGLEGGKEKLEEVLFGQLAKLTSAAATVGSETKEKTARVKVKQKQSFVLKLTVDKGIESFTLKVGGAIEFGQSVSVDGEMTPTDATGGTSTTSTDQPTPAEETTPTEPTPPTTETPSTSEPAPNVQPTTGKPAVLVIPGKKPALLKIPGKPTQPQQQKPQPIVKKPPLILIPKKKQP